VDLANRAGLPAGTLELRSHTREAGRELLARERFDHIVFTGSTRVGENIARAAAETLTPTTLELSGCDSALVLDDADPGLAARSRPRVFGRISIVGLMLEQTLLLIARRFAYEDV